MSENNDSLVLGLALISVGLSSIAVGTILDGIGALRWVLLGLGILLIMFATATLAVHVARNRDRDS